MAIISIYHGCYDSNLKQLLQTTTKHIYYIICGKQYQQNSTVARAAETSKVEEESSKSIKSKLDKKDYSSYLCMSTTLV